MNGRDDGPDRPVDRVVGPPSMEPRPRDPSESSGPRPTKTSESSTSEWRAFAYDIASSVAAVLLIGGFLFAVSGVWPPMVAVESGSMEPNMAENDLVFVMEETRFAGSGAWADTGVVPASAGEQTDYQRFGRPGDVIIYQPDGNGDDTPLIHRAMFWVNETENWYDKADRDALSGAENCDQLTNCPAPHAGFITKGDANTRYDQAGFGAMSAPVKPEWIVGTAEVRVPGLGWIRLRWV